MPSKLRKAIGAVKDHTSIGLAKVTNNNSSNLDIAVLKATTHEEVPIDARYIDEILLLTSASKTYAAASAQAIAKRIGRTRNWIVALKSLMLVLRIFQDGDPHFPREVLHCMKRGSKILNLSCFRDDSNSSPWDYTAFVRTFALYLDERLDCFLMGKLQRRAVNKERDSTYQRRQRANEHVCDMKPPMLLDRISYWQRLLDRAIAARPTGAAKTNRLVQLSLHSVVWESFDLYRDISDGLALLLDRFFHLQYQSCVDAFQTCIKASKQFEELCAFYTLCKSIGVGRTSEYPSVQKISEELIETLREFLKDQASFPTSNGRPVASQLLLPAPPTTASSSGRLEASEQSETSERTSLEDLVSVTDDAGTRPSISIDGECCLEQVEKQPQLEDLVCVNDVGTTPSVSIDQGGLAGLDQLLFDEMTQKEELQSPSVSGLPKGEREGWELVLAETARDLSSTQLSSNIAAGGFETSFLDDLYDQASLQQPHSNYNNPFLQDTSGITATSSAAPAIPVVDTFSSFHTFQATPTFCAQNSDEATGTMHIENDPFAPCTPQVRVVDQISDMSTNQQHLLHEQQLWLQHQNKIIARHIS